MLKSMIYVLFSGDLYESKQLLTKSMITSSSQNPEFFTNCHLVSGAFDKLFTSSLLVLNQLSVKITSRLILIMK